MQQRSGDLWRLKREVAFLARKPFAMKDTAFLPQVVHRADSGILLDLHNLYCNACNGQINLVRYLAHKPLDRVREMNLAEDEDQGGASRNSHSRPIAVDLRNIAREAPGSRPKLEVLNFEIHDTFLECSGEAAQGGIVEDTRDVGAVVGRGASVALPRSLAGRRNGVALPLAAWEAARTKAVWKTGADCHLYPEHARMLAL